MARSHRDSLSSRAGRPSGTGSRRPARPAPQPIDPDLPPPLGDAVRDLAVRRLARQAVRYPEMEIGGLDDSHASMAALDDRDAAFAHAIYDGAVRRWLTLSMLLGRLTSQPLEEMEARLRGALIGSAAQMILLDRVPVHAVINHAVEWCKQRIRPGAGAMANAVLRRLATIVLDESGEKRRRERWTNQRDELPLADGAALVLSEAILPEDEMERLGVATSHQASLLAAWRGRVGFEEVVRLAQHGLAGPPTVLNVRHMAREAGESGSGEMLVPHGSGTHAVFTGSRAELRRLLKSRRDVWVQDAGASGAVDSIADVRIGRGLIIDACAGQGTKTRQLAATFPDATIVATDVDGPRRETLARVFAGSEQVRVVSPKTLREEYGERADLVLLDVPCSNTGVLARRPEARYRYSDEAMKSLASVQRQIIADAIPLLSRGTGGRGGEAARGDGAEGGAGAGLGARRGMILYSTCSMEVEENEAIAGWARQWHEFAPWRERREAPAGGPGRDAAEYRDGAYSVLLR